MSGKVRTVDMADSEQAAELLHRAYQLTPVVFSFLAELGEPREVLMAAFLLVIDNMQSADAERFVTPTVSRENFLRLAAFLWDFHAHKG